MKLLICSGYVPYDTVAHGGGQTHNYYVKRLKKDTDIDMHLVTFASSDDFSKIDLGRYNISNTLIYEIKPSLNSIKNIIDRIVRRIIITINHFYPKLTYGKYLMLQALKKLKKDGYYPDIVELNWTHIVFFIPAIQKIFPNARYYAVEQDVTFLRYEREYLLQKDDVLKHRAKLKYEALKKTELDSLSKCDKIFVFNHKDKMLLLKNNISDSKIAIMVPYFKKIIFPLNKERKNTILFYGAMKRKENYTAAIWFIEYVFSKLRDTDFIFTILGSNPSQELLKYQNNRIIITGYQEDIQPYFEQALCLVAPLELGAGIKIKVLEALSAGLPVLGTDIASEGIDITQDVNFFTCKSPDDYINTIKLLYDNVELRMSVGFASRSLIEKDYDFDASFKHYIETISILIKKREFKCIYH